MRESRARGESATCACCPPESSAVRTVRGIAWAASRSTAAARVEPTPEAGGDLEMLVGRQLPVESHLLPDVPDPRQRPGPIAGRVDAVDRDESACRTLEAQEAADQRRLAGAIGADERRDAAAVMSRSIPSRAAGRPRR